MVADALREPESHRDFTAVWARVRGRLRSEFGDAAFRGWLKPLTLRSVREGVVRLSVPTRFMRDWVRSNYADRIRALWMAEMPGLADVEIVMQPATRSDQSSDQAGDKVGDEVGDPGEAPAGNGAGRPETPAAAARIVAARASDSGLYGMNTPALSLDGPLEPRLTFDNFVVGKTNELAYAAARRVADADSVPFNPLFLYSGVGLGKTHLMHAIAWHIRLNHPDRKVMYVSAERFMSQFICAVREKDTMAFKEQFRSVEVLMIDDIHFIGDKNATQEEFFHTFNALVDQNRQVVVSADKSPADLDGMEERLRSRLGWGLVADIHPTTYELRLGILQSKAERMDVHIPKEVMEFVAHRITSNVRELEGALTRLRAQATLVKRPVTLETAHEVLHDLLRANDRRVTIEEIQRKVAEHFKIKVSDMYSARRARAVARPRQVAMYLSKQLTTRSLPEIGRKFGGRDHTTVMHAIKKVDELKSTDSSFAEDVELLLRILGS